MSRSTWAAVLGLAVIAASLGATATCAMVLCGDHAAPAACHSSPAASTRLTDCCAAHSSQADEQRALPMDALSLVRVAALQAIPEAMRPGIASDPLFASAAVRGGPVALFTLHQSLLL